MLSFGPTLLIEQEGSDEIVKCGQFYSERQISEHIKWIQSVFTFALKKLFCMCFSAGLMTSIASLRYSKFAVGESVTQLVDQRYVVLRKIMQR